MGMYRACLTNMLLTFVGMNPSARVLLQIEEAAIEGLRTRLQQHAYAPTPAETAFLDQHSFGDDEEQHERTSAILAPYGVRVPIRYGVWARTVLQTAEISMWKAASLGIETGYKQKNIFLDVYDVCDCMRPKSRRQDWR